MSNSYYDLSRQSHLAEGRGQLIFQHPKKKNRLIKVVKPNEKKRILKRYSVWRYNRLRGWQRELSEYIATLSRTGTHCDRLTRYYGFCDTSYGPGIVVEKISDPNGYLAPTFSSYLNKMQHSATTLAKLRNDVEELFDTLNRDQVHFHDIHQRNIVVSGDTNPRLMVIDGLGNPALMPFTQFSKRAFRKIAMSGKDRILKAIDRSTSTI
ncbi:MULTISPECIES: YrbL family protein [Rhodobacterales]|uniref:YrbL family protein n=1 Tax=Rhodobacterales TaxID=204455 RepID=UPI0015F0D2C8|nr:MULTISPECIES: YrbL family protein [Rhodobacterales]MDO6590868.1 YrbL family protein [Yoonia sp. 1_MG-2023]